MSARLRLVTPNNENRSVPVRPPNSELRTREYLTPAEVEKLIKAAKDGRWGHRDATLVLLAFRHGLRASEICDLERSQVEFGRSPSLHVRRVKNGKPSVHPLRGDEVRALRMLHVETRAALSSRLSGRAIHAGRRQQAAKTHWLARWLRFPGARHMLRHAAATHWRTPDMTPGPFSTGSAIAQFSTQCATPNWRRRGLRISGNR